MSTAREGERELEQKKLLHMWAREKFMWKEERKYLKISQVNVKGYESSYIQTMADGLSELSAAAWITGSPCNCSERERDFVSAAYSIHKVLFVAAFQPTLLRNGMKWFFRFQPASKQHPSPSPSSVKLYPISSPISNISTSSSSSSCSCSCPCSFSGSWWFFLFSWQPFCHRPGPQPPPGRPVRPGSRGRRPQTVSMQRSMPAKPEVFPDLHLGRWVSLEMARMRLKPGTAIKMMWSSDRIDDSDKIGFDVRIWLYIYLLLFTICVKWRIKVFLQFDIYGK